MTGSGPGTWTKLGINTGTYTNSYKYNGEENGQTAYTHLCGKGERCRYAQDFLGFSWKELLANCAYLSA